MQSWSERCEVNLVTSIYGRPLGNYQGWTNTGLLRYVDDMRKDPSGAVRLQLPSVPEKSSKDNIIYKSQLVNKPGAFCEPSVIIGLLNPSVIIWFFGVFENLGFCCQ